MVIHHKGLEYRVRFTKATSYAGRVDYDKRTLSISTQHKSSTELVDTIIHELLHICHPELSEHAVATTTATMAGALSAILLAYPTTKDQ